MENSIKTFKQTAKIGVSGSFINQMMSNNMTLPEIGKGATQMHYTDRSCYEVISVSKDKKVAKLEVLQAKADSTKSLQHGHQNWVFEPTGHYIVVAWKWGAWRIKSVIVVFTDEFRDKISSLPLRGGDEYNELTKDLWDDNGNLKYVKGKTIELTEWNKINIIFGVKDYYYDWSF